MRRVAWPVFAVAIIGVFAAITVWIVESALDAGAGVRIVAAAGWLISFAVGWRVFSRSHGDVPSQKKPRKINDRLGTAALVVAVCASTILANLDNSIQVVCLAFVTGFCWPMFYWLIRSLVKHPERRERLWSGELKPGDVPN
jgi:hypothetical protein